MRVTTIGLDLAKTLFQVHGVDGRGRAVLRKRLPRAKMLTFFAHLPRGVVGLEACGGAHYWARELRALGHDARLMPPQCVKSYVKTNKHDAADAEACCARRSAPTAVVGAGSQARVPRPSMRFVPVKTEVEQATLMLRAAPGRPPRSALGARRGVRDQLIGQRTATLDALRGHLAEFGIVAAQRQAGLRQLLAALGQVEDERVPALARELLQTLVAHLRELEVKIAEFDRRLVGISRSDPISRSLAVVPGSPGTQDRSRWSVRSGEGPVIATAFSGHRTRRPSFPFGASPGGLAGSPGTQDRPRWSVRSSEGPPTARHRRQGTPARAEQARRRLPPAAADPRRRVRRSDLGHSPGGVQKPRQPSPRSAA